MADWYTLSDGNKYRVVDGDTIANEANVRFRIGGIDTYEVDKGVKEGEGGSNTGEAQRQILESMIKNKNYSDISFSGNSDTRRDDGESREIISLGNGQGNDLVNTMYYQGLNPLRGSNLTQEGQQSYEMGFLDRLVNKESPEKNEYYDNLRNNLKIAGMGDYEFAKKPAINEAYFAERPEEYKGVMIRHADRDMYNKANNSFVSSFGAGIDGMQSGFYGVMEMTGHKFGSDWARSVGEGGVLHNMAQQSELPYWTQDIKDINSIGDFAEWSGGALGGSLPYFGLMATAMIPGVRMVTMPAMALMYAGQTWNEMEGDPDKKSMTVALAAGVLQAWFERLGGRIVFGASSSPKVLSSKKGIRNAIKALAKQQRNHQTGQFIKKNISNKEAERLLYQAKEAEIVQVLKSFNENKVVWAAYAQTVRDKALSGMVGEGLTEGAQESVQYIGAWLGSEEGKKQFNLKEFGDRVVNATAAGALLGAGIRGGGGILTTPNPYDVGVRQIAHDKLKNIYGKYIVTDPENREAILDEASSKYISDANYKGTGNANPYAPKEKAFITVERSGKKIQVEIGSRDKEGNILTVINPETGQAMPYKAFKKKIKEQNETAEDPNKEYKTVYDVAGGKHRVEVTASEGEAYRIIDPNTGEEIIGGDTFAIDNPLSKDYLMRSMMDADGQRIKIKDLSNEQLLKYHKDYPKVSKAQKKKGKGGAMALADSRRNLAAVQAELERRGLGDSFETIIINAGKKGLDDNDAEKKRQAEIKKRLDDLRELEKKQRLAFKSAKDKADNRGNNNDKQIRTLFGFEASWRDTKDKFHRAELEYLSAYGTNTTKQHTLDSQGILNEAMDNFQKLLDIPNNIYAQQLNVDKLSREQKNYLFDRAINGVKGSIGLDQYHNITLQNHNVEALDEGKAKNKVDKDEDEEEIIEEFSIQGNSEATKGWVDSYAAAQKIKSGFSRAWEYASQFRWLSTGNQVLVDEFKREEGEDAYQAQTILRAELDSSGFVNTITTFGQTFAQNRRNIEGGFHRSIDSILENFMSTIPGLKANRKKHRAIAYDLLVDNLESRGFNTWQQVLTTPGVIPAKYRNIDGIQEAYDTALAAVIAYEAMKEVTIQRVNENYSAPAFHTLTQRKISQTKVIASKEKFIKLLMEGKAVYLKTNLPSGANKALLDAVKMTRAQAEREYAAIVDAPSGYDYQDWADTELLSKKPIGLKRRISFDNPAFKDFHETNSYTAVKHRATEVAHYVSDMQAFGFGGQALHSRIQGIYDQLQDYYRQKGDTKQEAKANADRWMPRIADRIFNQYLAHRGEYHKLKDKNLRHLASNIGSMLSLAFMALATFASFAEGGLVFRNIVGVNAEEEKKFGMATAKMALYTKQAAIAHMKKFVDLEGDWANTEYRQKMFEQQVKRGLTTHDMGAGHVIDAAYDDDKQNYLQREIMPRYYNIIGLTPLTTWMRILRDTSSVEEIGSYMNDAMTAYQVRKKLMLRGNDTNNNQPMNSDDAAKFFTGADMTQKEARAWMAMTQLGASPMEFLGVYDKLQIDFVNKIYSNKKGKKPATSINPKTGKPFKSQMSDPLFHEWLETQMKKSPADLKTAEDKAINVNVKRFMEHLDVMRNNFVDASLVNPDPGKRPPVYSDGRMRLLFLFQGYLATFSAQIARPILRDLAGKGAPKDQLNAAGVVLTMMALAFLGLSFKDELKYGERPAWLSDAQYIQRGIQGSGIMGQTERVFNLMFPLYTSEADTIADKAFAEIGALAGAGESLFRGTSHLMDGDEELAYNQLLKLAPGGVLTRGRQNFASFMAGED